MLDFKHVNACKLNNSNIKKKKKKIELAFQHYYCAVLHLMYKGGSKEKKTGSGQTKDRKVDITFYFFVPNMDLDLDTKTIIINKSRYYRRLCRAVSKNDVESVDTLLNVDKVDPNLAVHQEKSPLWIACENNNLEIVRLLITNHFNPADPNIPYNGGTNPFVEAVCHLKMDLVTLLVKEANVAVNLNWMWGGCSLLSWAVCSERVVLVEMLLKAGANPNVAENISKLPIYSAVYGGNLQIVQLLLQYGADMKPCCNELLQDTAYRNHCDVLEHLLQHAHNKNLLSSCTRDLMCLAIWHGVEESIKVFLRWGFFTNESMSSGVCCVFRVAAASNVAVLKMLIELKPQCLQESRISVHESFRAELIEARKHPIRLDILCRTKIIQQLGFKPISKVETLPLPRILKDFVQFKNLMF